MLNFYKLGGLTLGEVKYWMDMLKLPGVWLRITKNALEPSTTFSSILEYADPGNNKTVNGISNYIF